jgi:hypothetical protein
VLGCCGAEWVWKCDSQPPGQPLDPTTLPPPRALNALLDSTCCPKARHSSFCSLVVVTSGHFEHMLSAVQKCDPGRCVLSQILTEPVSGTSSRQHCLPSLPQSAVLRVQIPNGSPAPRSPACQEPCTAQHSTVQHSTSWDIGMIFPMPCNDPGSP